MEYNFTAIEERAKQFWEANEVYKVTQIADKPKYYVLDMFPYPSGAGLHVGHPLGYIASDIYARFKRLKGFNVLHPMGFDAFGLPAEQYAIKTGQHPAITTEKNIDTYKKQLAKVGFSYDWSREVSTCDPNYYKWTQWVFLQLYKSWYNKDKDKAEAIDSLMAHFKQNGNTNLNAACSDEQETFTAEQWATMSEAEQQNTLMNYRLAYQSFATVNWCPELGTVLANDEVKDGLSERGGHPVVRKQMKQWSLRITAYSQRLLDGLETLDWSLSMKEQQRNWIGRSEGATVFFQLADGSGNIEVFTTRPDTIFGATFMVLAPEHELIEKITTEAQKAEIDQYIAYVKSRSDIERQAEKKVTGAFTGTYAINPLNNEKIPIWISEYVLIGYGTGAIMAVPSDDDRDNAFAEKFELPIIDVIDKSDYPGATRHDKLGKMINSGFINGMEVPDAIKATIAKIEEMNIGQGKINYRQRDAGYSRQRYWGEPFPIIYKNDIPYPVAESELPVELPAVDSYKPTGTGEGPLAQNKDWVNVADGGVRETDTMPGYAGSSWYYLRYMDPKNEEQLVGKEALAYWQNVDFYLGGTEHAVGHLLYSRFWFKFLRDRGFIDTPTDEPFQKLVNQGMIQGRSNFVYRVKGTNQFVSYGLRKKYETTPLHVNVNIVKNDILDTEAFRKSSPDYADAEFILEENGTYVCGWEIEKMSKSKYNVVNPDEIVAEYGADCFRMFEMFLGPLEAGKPWDTKGIEGVSKFLKRFWRLFKISENGQPQLSDAKPTDAELKTLHKTIKKVTGDVERLAFNTGVSAFMVCVNELIALKCDKRAILEPLVILLAPFAPFTTEELWQSLGNEGSVHQTTYPVHNEAFIKEDSYQYPIRIGKKVRTKIAFPVQATQAEVEPAVLANEVVAQWIGDKPVKRFVFVQGRIINIVI